MQIAIGTIVQASGSAKVYVGDTQVMIGVKLELGEPLRERPDEGILKFTVHRYVHSCTHFSQMKLFCCHFLFGSVHIYHLY